MAEETQLQDPPASTQSAASSAALSGSEQKALQAAALQSMAVALSLALHNAVAEQQNGQILRMALTTVAAKAILHGRREEADEILKLANSPLVVPDFSRIIAEFRSYLESVGLQLQDPLSI